MRRMASLMSALLGFACAFLFESTISARLFCLGFEGGRRLAEQARTSTGAEVRLLIQRYRWCPLPFLANVPPFLYHLLHRNSAL
jgi:hypothetical protein